MEDNINRIDQQDELQQIKDRVKNLELELRLQNSSRNDLDKKFDCIAEIKSRLSCISASRLDDCDVITVNDEDFTDRESWLHVTENGGAQDKRLDLRNFLHLDVNNNNNEFQAIRQCVQKRLEDLEQGPRRCIDTRTFTRPKNRVSRPALETMLESPIVENRSPIGNQLPSPWFSMKNAQFLGRNFEDIYPNLDNCSHVSLISEPDNMHMFNMTDKSIVNSPMCLFSEQQVTEETLNATFNRVDNLNTTRPVINDQAFINEKKILLQEQEAAFQNTALNSTFTYVDGCGSSGSSHRSTRTASCESGMDEDQLSSASDSSYSSANRPMNAGDVHIIAHIQEESLKHANSTPVRVAVDGALFQETDLPSPIHPSNGPEINRGYLSDHSDSAESRAKSSRSSMRSSPSGSPFGSTQLLNNGNGNLPYRPSAGLPQRELRLIRPTVKPEFKNPAVPAMRPPENLGARPTSRLRAPAVKPAVLSSGQPMPRIPSGIPRPPSRLPTPRVRSSFVAPAPKK